MYLYLYMCLDRHLLETYTTNSGGKRLQRDKLNTGIGKQQLQHRATVVSVGKRLGSSKYLSTGNSGVHVVQSVNAAAEQPSSPDEGKATERILEPLALTTYTH